MNTATITRELFDEMTCENSYEFALLPKSCHLSRYEQWALEWATWRAKRLGVDAVCGEYTFSQHPEYPTIEVLHPPVHLTPSQ